MASGPHLRVLRALWVPGETQRCRIHIPETALLHKDKRTRKTGLAAWLTTSKEGTVEKRRGKQATPANLLKRMQQGAKPGDASVAIAITEAGQMQTLSFEGLTSMLTQLGNGTLGSIAAIQTKVEAGSQALVLQHDLSSQAPTSSPAMTVRAIAGGSDSEEATSAVNQAALALSSHLAHVRGAAVEQMTTLWAVDGRNRAWLMRTQAITMAGDTAGGAGSAAAAGNAELGLHIDTDATRQVAMVAAKSTSAADLRKVGLGLPAMGLQTQDDSALPDAARMPVDSSTAVTHYARGRAGQQVVLHGKGLAMTPAQGPGPMPSASTMLELEQSMEDEEDTAAPAAGGNEAAKKYKARLRKSRAQLEQALLANEELVHQLRAVQEQSQSASAKLRAITTQNPDVNEHLLEQIAQLSRDCEQVRTDGEASQAQALQQLQAVHHQELLALRSALQDLDEQATMQRRQLAMEQQKAAEAVHRADNSHKTAKRLEAEVNSLVAQMRTRQPTPTLALDAEVRKLQGALKDAEAEVDVLKQSNELLATKMAYELDAARDKTRALNAELDKSQASAIGSGHALPNQSASAAAAATIGEAKAAAQSARTEAARLRTVNEDLERALVAVRADLLQTRNQLSSAQSEVAFAHQRIAALAPVQATVQTEMQALRDELTLLRAGDLHGQASLLNAVNESAAATITRLTSELAEEKAARKAAERRASGLAQSLQDAQAALRNAREQQDKALADAHGAAQQLLEAANQEHAAALQAAVTSAESRERANAENALADLRDQMAQLSGTLAEQPASTPDEQRRSLEAAQHAAAIAQLQLASAAAVEQARKDADVATAAALTKLDREWQRAYDEQGSTARKAMALHAELTASRQEADKLRARVDALQQQLADSESLHARTIAEAQQQVAAELSRAVQQYNARVSEASEQAVAAARSKWLQDAADLVRNSSAQAAHHDITIVVAAARAEAEAAASEHVRELLQHKHDERLCLLAVIDGKEKALQHWAVKFKTASVEHERRMINEVAAARRDEAAKVQARLANDTKALIAKHEDAMRDQKARMSAHHAAQLSTLRSQLRAEADVRVAHVADLAAAAQAAELDALQAKHALQLSKLAKATQHSGAATAAVAATQASPVPLSPLSPGSPSQDAPGRFAPSNSDNADARIASAVKRAEAAHARRLADLKAEHAAELEALRAELQHAKAAAAASAEREHQALAAMRDRYRKRQEAALAELKQAHAVALQEAKAAVSSQLESQSHAPAVHAAVKAALQAARRDWDKQMSSAVAKLGADAVNAQRAVEAARVEWQQEYDRVVQDKDQQLEALSGRLAEMGTQLAAASQQHAELAEQLSSADERAQATADAQLQATLAAEREKGNAAAQARISQAVETATAKVVQQAQQDFAQLAAKHDEATSAVMAQADALAASAAQASSATPRTPPRRSTAPHSAAATGGLAASGAASHAANASAVAAAEARAMQLQGEVLHLKQQLSAAQQQVFKVERALAQSVSQQKSGSSDALAAARRVQAAELHEARASFEQQVESVRVEARQANELVDSLTQELRFAQIQLHDAQVQAEEERARAAELSDVQARADAQVEGIQRVMAELKRRSAAEQHDALQLMQRKLDIAAQEAAGALQAAKEAAERQRRELLQQMEQANAQAAAHVQALQEQHAQAMAQLKQQMLEDATKSLEELRDEMLREQAEAAARNDATMEALKRELQAAASEQRQEAIAQARAEMREEEERRIAQLEARMQDELAAAGRDAEQAQARAVAEARTQFEASIQGITQQHEAALAAKDQDRADALQEAGIATAALLAETRAQHEAAVQDVQVEMSRALRALRSELDQQRLADIKHAVEDAVAAAEAQAEQDMAEVHHQLDQLMDEREDLQRQLMENDALANQARLQAKADLARSRMRAERASMYVEELLTKSAELSPEKVAARIQEAMDRAEEFLQRGLAQAKSEMDAELQRRTKEFAGREAEMLTRMEHQSNTFASMHDEWTQQRDSLQKQLHEAEEARDEAMNTLQSSVEAARAKGQQEQEAALELAAQRAEQNKNAAAQEARSITEANMTKHYEQVLQSFRDSKTEELADLQRKFEARFEEFSAQSQEMHHAVIAQINSRHEAAMISALQQATEDRETALKRVVQEKLEAVTEAEARARAEVNQAREAAADMLERMRAEYTSSLQEAEDRWSAEKAAAVEAAVAQAQATAADAMQQAQANWQRRLEEVVAVKEREMLEAVMDIRAEAERLTRAHAQNMERLAMAAEDTRVRLLEQHASELQAAVDATLEACEQEKAAALAAFNAEWEARMAERERELQATHEAALALLRQQYGDELESTMKEMEAQRQTALEAFTEEVQAQRKQMVDEMARQVRAAVDEAKAEAQMMLQAAEAAAAERERAAVEAAHAQAALERAAAIDAVRDQCAREQEEALQELHDESEKLLASIEGAMNKLRDERDVTEEEAAELREQLEAQEELAFKLRKEIESLRKAGVLQGMKLMMLTALHLKRYNAMVRQKDEEREAALNELQASWEKKYRQLETKLEVERQKVARFISMQSTLEATLTHHKREMLLSHKIKSSVLQNDLADVYDLKIKLQEKYEAMLKGLGNMQAQIKLLRDQNQQLAGQSAMRDGEPNEYLRQQEKVIKDMKAMSTKAAEQQDKIAHVQQQLDDAERTRLEKEQELKYVEAQLVNTLLQQQRALMSVLRSVAVDASEYGIEPEHHDAHEMEQLDGLLAQGVGTAPPATSFEGLDASSQDFDEAPPAMPGHGIEEHKSDLEVVPEHREDFSDASSDDGHVVGTRA